MLCWRKEYHDGPYTLIRIAWLCIVYNWDGLPYIFQEDTDA